MQIVQMPSAVVFIPYKMLPLSALPNTALSSFLLDGDMYLDTYIHSALREEEVKTGNHDLKFATIYDDICD
jgi:hypothetical protein